MEPTRTAFVTATPVAPLSPLSRENALPALSPTRQANLSAKSAVPRCRLESGTPANVLTVLQARAQDDTKRVADFISAYTPSANTAAALGAAVLLALSPTLSPPPAHADVPETAPSQAVVDDASVVTNSSEELFEKSSQAIKNKTGINVRFVIVRSLPFGDSPDDYARELATQWRLGDDDVLFAASTKLARAGVYVGDAAKKLLTDEIAKSVAEETFGIPAGDERYGAGLMAVSNRLIPVLGGKEDPGPPETRISEVVQNYKTKQETNKDRGKYIKVVGGILVIAFVAPVIQTYWYVRDD